MKLAAFRPGILPAVVRFWNRCFSERRNFFPVTEEVFLRRVVEKRTAVERFDPEGFVVALAGRKVVGLVHAGVRSEEICRSLDASWPGGTQGAIYLIQVDPAHARRGIGSALWHRALVHLRKTRQVVLDGQCVNPFYGNSEGPFTPFWGTPEGISVEWMDSATKKFLARKGFAPRFKAVQLALDIPASGAPPLGETERALGRQGFRVVVHPAGVPEVGRPEGERRPVAPGLDFECVSVVRDRKTVGAVVTFPLKEVREGLFAIYEAKVLEALRGKALGKRLLAAAVARLRGLGGKSCEVLTIPELSPAALKVYEGAGFQRVASWAVY